MRRSAALALAAAAGCARIEAPPGGPPDTQPPQLVAVTPESLAVLPDFDDAVEFRFDEVISEGTQPNVGAGTGDLERLVLLSPSPNVPEVAWRRNRIAVRPREGWQPDRVYRVELLPGVADLRQNRQTGDPVVLTFTTGAPPPSAVLRGQAVDWSTGRPAPGALIEAVLDRDSLVYRSTADSAGMFRFGPLPSGDYTVYAVLDANRNRRRDPREAYGEAAVGADSTDIGALYAFVHDTTPPRARAAVVLDSVRATLSASQPLLPGQAIPATAVRVLLLPDSTPVRVAGAALRSTDDTTAAAERRPPLTDQVIVEVAEPWTRGARYVLVVDGVRNVTGVAGELRGLLTVPGAAADTAPPGP